MFNITFYSQPISKKNSQKIIIAGKRPYIVPSDAYRKYVRRVKEQLIGQTLPALAGPLHVKCLYYMETAREPDLTNLMAATHDILEEIGVILDDKQIKNVDGSRIMGKDKEPRVEIFISQFEE